MSPRSKRALGPGQHAVVTGGSSGLGEAVAGELLVRGVDVTLVARGEQGLDEAAARLGRKTSAGRVYVAAADVTSPLSLDGLFTDLASSGRAVDLLVNSAGILREGYFATLPASAFTNVMDVNFHGTVNTIRAALPSLQRRQGAIVNVSSVAGLMGVFGYTPYSAAKHALVGFTDSLRFELEPQGMRVHLVCPGEFDSPMVAALEQHRTPENRAHTLTIPRTNADAVARGLVRGVDRGSPLIIPGRRAALTVLGQRLAPGIGNAVARRRIARAGRSGP